MSFVRAKSFKFGNQIKSLGALYSTEYDGQTTDSEPNSCNCATATIDFVQFVRVLIIFQFFQLLSLPNGPISFVIFFRYWFFLFYVFNNYYSLSIPKNKLFKRHFLTGEQNALLLRRDLFIKLLSMILIAVWSIA